MPTVSVIIPTYNRAKYLALTLESIVRQTYQDFEIIVVDDGTPNNENEIICSKFDKVRYYKIKNTGGPAAPRNTGIQKASGKYIAFVDDDDLWLPQKLGIQVKILETNPDFGLVHSYCQVINEYGIVQDKIIGRPGSIDIKHGDVRMKMIGNWTIMSSTPLIKRSIIEKVGYFNEKMPPAGEDTEYWTRCSFETKFYYIDEPLVKYRVHSKNISSDKKKYYKLDLYLKEILLKQKKKNKISNTIYKKLLSKICIKQINHIKQHCFLSLKILFELDTFWFLRWTNFKSLIIVVFFNKIKK
ncbi:glycosyltransferase family 2 protein [Flavobacterium sp. TR2]|uniref:glycosyltransferase family 2 protein n=1 Tax=Flavobacterium sp. TR2 TaxID=2977321 RepID=UPI0021B13062|nr:glycosyltransferase family A protein [Flavobacterium sp. TR2]UWY28609.1 glycosyltransferase family 2 protein [Flavobacterium sp. TR2]